MRKPTSNFPVFCCFREEQMKRLNLISQNLPQMIGSKFIIKCVVVLLFGVFLIPSTFAQQTATYTSDFAKFQHGLKLYKQHQYSAAQRIFERVNKRTQRYNLEAESAYYSALSAIHLDQPNAERRLIHFVENYPESSKQNSAYAQVGNYYFQKGAYSKAEKWYDEINREDLSSAEKRAYDFNKGYVSFKRDKPKKAEKYFNRVRNDKEYGSQAKYYLGYLAYEGDDFEEAEDLFEEVDEEDKEDKKVSYFQSNISFKSGDFEKAIEQGKEQLPKSNRREQSELNKIIGESYFNLEEYEEAIPYLEKYEGKRRRWSNTDYYQLGYAYYKMEDYEKAISQFNKIIDGKDDVAQNAYYHLAQSYINLDQKQEALNAFKNASEMDFDEEIKEDAALNYAKLSYDIGNNYKSIPEVLTEFLEDYPNSDEKGEVQELLVNSYVTSKNYKKAMEMLEESKSFDDKSVYQIVAFYRGLELYEEEEYEEAIKLFEKSIKQNQDVAYTVRATFWKAESEYNSGDYKEALISYKQFKDKRAAQGTSEYKDIDYNIGYTYFNQQKYEGAAKHFKAYTEEESADAKQKNDAFLRLGDSYFAMSNYWDAMEQYNMAIEQKNVHSDYAYYQKAISYGFVDRNDNKIEGLNEFIENYPESIYRDDALYELGNTYADEERSQEAIEAYGKIIDDMPKSNYLSKSLLKQGLIYYNSDQNEEALSNFKKVVSDFPNSEEANQAVKSARNVYVDMGQTDEYASWVKSLDFVDVSDSDIDDASFESADNQLVDGNNEAAIKGFEKYLKDFPKGGQALEAHYHLGQLYYKQKEYGSAEPHYAYVVDRSRNEYTEKSLERLARIYLEDSDQEKAVPVLQKLEEEGKLQQNITFAQSNLMKAYYDREEYSKTVEYAEKVLDNDGAGSRAKNDAQIFIARSAIKTNDEEKAKNAYAEVAKDASGEMAAEAQYYDAYFKRKEGDYQASNEAVQVLAKDYSGYKKYSVKGLLVMGKNFYDLDDAYQATYILQNIIDNFEDYPDEVDKAKKELKKIKAKEAETNSSLDSSGSIDEEEIPLEEIQNN